MAVYLANVIIAFEADGEGEAADAVSAMLSENLQYGAGAILDWCYRADYDGGAYHYQHARRSSEDAEQARAEGFGADLNTVYDEAEPELQA